jgi:hypothetical protein
MKLAFYKSNKYFIDRLTQYWTNGDFSHVEIVLDEVIVKSTKDIPSSWKGINVFIDSDLDIPISNKMYLCGSSSGIDKCTRVKLIDIKAEDWHIVDIEGLIDEEEVIEFFKINSGRRYDYWALLGFLFRPSKGSKDKYFCSEIVAHLLGFEDAYRYDPNTLYDIVSNKKILKTVI